MYLISGKNQQNAGLMQKEIQDTQLVASGDDVDMVSLCISLIFHYSQVEPLLAVNL